jgi:hypothetical protein
MLERPMFEDPEIRAAVADSGMAIVWISPGAWPNKMSSPVQPELSFKPKEDAIAGLQRVLSGLARESGYGEIEFAPLLVTGHSAASPFVWGMAAALPERVFAALPYKGYTVGAIPEGVPTLHVAQEWAEWGKGWGEVWRKEFATTATMREKDPSALLGDFADLGSGHFDFRHESAGVLAMFIRKAARYRLPKNASLTGLVVLRPVSRESGVLVDPKTLGTREFRAVPYRSWKGDAGSAFWYLDQEMAQRVSDFMRVGLAKQPQTIDYVVDGRPVPLVDNGFAVLRPEFLDDGVTFRVHAEVLDSSPSAALYPGTKLGHAAGAIQYRVSSGALRQVGPDTFQVAARPGGLLRQGQPWEPWIMASQAGDALVRSADKPAHLLVSTYNTEGEPQTIQFPQPANLHVGQRSTVIEANATSGLPVELYVESGPAVMEGTMLRVLKLPPRTRYPVHILVSAYQWGMQGDRPVRTVGPITREILLER